MDGRATSFSAAVIGAQGLKGEVKVKIFTESADTLARYGVLHAKDGRTFVDHRLSSRQSRARR